MNIFKINEIKSFPFNERDKNVFYKNDDFKMRIIELDANQQLPECKMESHVIFQILEGKVEIHVNNEKHYLIKGQILVSEPAFFSMKAIEASRLVGIQINKQKR